jgi:hypothetical protein
MEVVPYVILLFFNVTVVLMLWSSRRHIQGLLDGLGKGTWAYSSDYMKGAHDEWVAALRACGAVGFIDLLVIAKHIVH